MEMQHINGDNALAWGAIEAGVSIVTGYPGSPGTGTFNALFETAQDHGHQAEWCVNERVALDIAAGASQGGKRALVCLKSVGMNVALDTLMVLNMTGVHAGLVILMGDDPGAWGSQNEQDTRPLGPLAEVPMLEPGTPQEARRMMSWAFDFSEALNTVVIIRITRSLSISRAPLPPMSPPAVRTSLPPDREPMRWISALRTTQANHARVHQKLKKAASQFNTLPFNRLEGNGPRGVLAGGMAHTKLGEALAGADRSQLTVLKLSTLYPLPHDLIAQFLAACDEVLVLEEVDPYLEDSIKSIGYDTGATPKIRGKRTGHVNWEGELFRWHIQKALDAYLPGFAPTTRYTEANWEQEKPLRQNHCAACPYLDVLTAFREEAHALGQNPFLSGDPGCVVMAAHLLDTKLSMGSAIGVASGLGKAGVGERTVAVFGDSAFYHGGINALIQARANRTNALVLILDNGGSLTTGHQSTPDRGLDLGKEKGPAVRIQDLVTTCGVEALWTVEEQHSEAHMRAVFREALQRNGLGLIVLRTACNVLKSGQPAAIVARPET